MKAKDLALKLLQVDQGGDDVFMRIDLDGQSYCVEPDKVQWSNGAEEHGVVITPAKRFKSKCEVELEGEP